MTHFRPSMIATMVASALTVGTIGAVNATPSKQLNISADTLAQVAQSAKAIKAQRQRLSNETTVSGMKNTFDAQLNKSTFTWKSAKDSANHNRPEMIAVALEDRNAFAGNHYLNVLTGVNIDKASNATAELYNIHDLKRGGIIARYKQQVNGVEVFNRAYNVMMDRNHSLVAGSGYFADVDRATSLLSPAKAAAAFGNPVNAVSQAFSDMGGDNADVQLSKKVEDKYTTFDVTNKASGLQLVGEPRTKKVYFEKEGKLVAAHYVEVQVGEVDSTDSEYYSYVIDAKSKEVLFKNNLKAHANDFSYRAFANAEAPHAPWDGPHGNVNPALTDEDPTAIVDAPMVTLAHGPISTMDPWLAEGATETIGNNVLAYVDVIPGDGLTFGDYTADVTSDGTFDYKVDPSQKEHSMNNRKAAIVNLFYMNNYLHDEFYDHGFDEASGNAQMDNFERGGEGNDPLKVESQDYSGTDNANMSTPADGVSPRMQMFLWNQAEEGVHYGVDSTSHDDLDLSSALASFGPAIYNVDGDIVRIVDGTAPGWDGCEAAENVAELDGKIALIDRGACSFAQKVMNAQDAGAIGVLVANNRGGDVASGLGGTGDDVTIPALMITQNNGAAIQALLDNNEVVTVNMMSTDDIPFKDSSWDNAIVSHEWGHYISNRLVGNASGLSNNQGGSMGEGWGDFHALLTVSEADEAMIAGNEMFQKPYAAITYVRSFVNGIRLYPYTTNMDINQHTFDSISDNPAVHASGNVWATMLWDSFVGLINDERYDYAQAKSVMMDYLVMGYKMTPNAPTYTEARDAILAAAYANEPADYDIILAAFARRGMGLGAVSPHRDSVDHSGVVESYSVTHSAFAASSHMLDTNFQSMTAAYCSNDYVLDKGETGAVNFTITNHGSEVYTGVTAKVEVVSDHTVTFANDGMVTFDDLGVTGSVTSSPLTFTLDEAGTAEKLELKLTFPNNADETGGQEYMVSTTVNYDFVDQPLVGHSAATGAEDLSILNDFKERVLAGGDLAKGTGQLTHDRADTWGDFGIFDAGMASLFINNNGYFSDVVYETKPITVGLLGNFTVEWLHYYDFETDFDGGVVEISINGAPWLDVLDAGGQFLSQGYTGELIAHSSQPLPDRAAFTGISADAEGVVFPSFINGNTVQFRFRAGSDGGSAVDGWLIDNIKFSNIDSGVFSNQVTGERDAAACDNRMPFVSVSEEQSVNEGDTVTFTATGTDMDGDDLMYTWSQVSGPEVELTADGASVSFTAPEVTTDGGVVVLSVMASDGHMHAMGTATANVADVVVVVTPPPAVVNRSGGGGSTGLLALLLAPLAFVRRRRIKK